MVGSHQRITVLFAIFLLGPACKTKDPYYCEGAPLDHCLLLDAELSCTSSSECSGDTPVCDVGGRGVCVQCTPAEHEACTGTTPACRDNTCQSCIAHAECDSGACLPDGSCGDPGQVAYVQAGGTGTQPCAKESPCGTLQEGITAVNANRPYIKVVGTGTLTPNTTTTIDGKAVTILADPGAKLDRMGDGVVLEVRNTGADVQIYDLEITGASGAAGDVGISIVSGGMPKLALTRVKVTNNIGGGISASGGMLTATQSTISGNAGGGISISGGEFDLTNNFIVGNGGPGTVYGGLRLDQTSTGTRRFEFNTVTNNNGMAGFAIGVVCTLVAQPVTFSNNIVYDNQMGGGRTQVGGMNCSWTYSDIGPDTVTGMGNINMDPMFLDPVQNNFHLKAQSPARDAANPGATLAVDFDGDVRPQGPARDIGADEVP